jgi:hypothetical protein
MLSQIDIADLPEHYYDDFVGIEIYVPCSTWEKEEASKCWGQDFEGKQARGVVTKVAFHRKTRQPKFEIKFPEKKSPNTFVGYDLAYVLSYCPDLPLKYHTLKAEHIKATARKTELVMIEKDKNCASSGDDEVLVVDLKKKAKGSAKSDAVCLNQDEALIMPNSQKRSPSGSSGGKFKKTKKHSVISEQSGSMEYGSSDEESENEVCAEDEEVPDLLEDDADEEDAEGEDITHFQSDLWKYKELPIKNEFQFKGATGPQHVLPVTTATPFEYFCLFIPIFYWERWAKYTNDKAEREPKQPRDWKKTTGAEIKAWVASVIWWTLGATQSLDCFWRDDYDRNFIKRWFAGYRWMQLKRFFKVSDPAEDETKKGDKLQKVRDIWTEFISRCKINYWPAQQIGVDEAIKKFKGRCSFKQYIKSKPVRWGLKVFCVCCSLTGYLWNAVIYVGKNEEEDSKQKELSATHAIVRNLLQPLSSKNHTVHMDNWFTSIPLFNDLAKMEIWSCGTIRVNRKGLCPMVTMTKKDEKALKKSPGTTRWASYGYLCYISWYAKRAVHVLTNCYQPIADDESGTIKHWFTDKGEKVQREISRPPAVKYYNMYMGAVDMYDQYRSYIKLDLRSRKFWHPLFWLIVESALVNAWLVYKASRELALLPLEYTMFTFRKSVALALVSEWETVGCRHRTSQQSPTKKMQTKTIARYHLKKVVQMEGTRFSSPDHHFSYLAQLPLPPDSSLKKRQMRCRQCKNKRTTYWCKECEQPLCRAPCFLLYHTKPVAETTQMVDEGEK